MVYSKKTVLEGGLGGLYGQITHLSKYAPRGIVILDLEYLKIAPFVVPFAAPLAAPFAHLLHNFWKLCRCPR